MKNTRRHFIKKLGAAAITVPLCSLTLAGVTFAASTKKVHLEDSLAIALGYVHDSPYPAKRCAGCQLYKGSASAEWGKCAIFSGKLVNAKGWCGSWSA